MKDHSDFRSDPGKGKIVLPRYKAHANYLPDPAKIQTAFDHSVVGLLYSPLIVRTPEGHIVSGLASEFGSAGEIVWFNLRSDSPVSSEDVVASLNRLMILGTNTHGKLESFLCGNQPVRNLENPCEGIRATGPRRVELVVRDASFVPELLNLLTSMDFAIVPRWAIETKKPELPIKDYALTSGPYRSRTRELESDIYLQLNQGHFQVSGGSPAEIEFRAIDLKEDFSRLTSGQLDLLANYWPLTLTREILNSIDRSQFIVHDSAYIMTAYIEFTPEGRKRYSLDQRLNLAQKIQERLLGWKDDWDADLVPANEFFSPAGSGGLNENQKAFLQAQRARSKSLPAGSGSRPAIVLNWLLPSSLHERLIQECPELVDYRHYDKRISQLPESERPDFILVNMDSVFDSDLSILSYLHSLGRSGLNDKEFSDWTESYLRSVDDTSKAAMVREFHFGMLKNGTIFPIAHQRYRTIIRRSWSIDLNPLKPNSYLWTLKRVE